MNKILIRSVNVGLPKFIEWKREQVLTGIFKSPVDKALQVSFTQIEGDGQADLVNHGGPNKAVYVYASEHYPYWNQFLQKEIVTGGFGENITTEGLLDNAVFIGDEYRFGTAILMAVQPRMPCAKLGIRFNNVMMPKHFYHARRNGIYFKVIQEGMIAKGDGIVLLKRSEYDITIQDIVDNYVLKEKDMNKVKQLAEIPILPPWFREQFSTMLK
ncbi:MAG: MOSC domain-containing protein [Chitinophagaceae bacterium]